MKILISIPWYHPAYKAGGPVQSIKNLVEAGWKDTEFYIFTGSKDLDGSLLEDILTDQWVKTSAHCHVYYRQNTSCVAAWRQILLEFKFDLIFINGIYSFCHTLLPIWFANENRFLLSARGMLHPGALGQKRIKKSLYLPFLLTLLRRRNVEFHATDADEQYYIRKKMGDSFKVHIAPNFPRIFSFKFHNKQSDHLKLVTVALVSPMKNHLLVLQALSAVDCKVQYDIIGPIKDADYWRLCEAAIAHLPAHIQVNYKGALPPDQIEQVLHQADVFICPSRSENFGHGFLEAFTAGLPVITSEHTPWKQLQIQKAGLNLKDTVEALTDGIRFFAKMNQETYQIWSASANQYGIAAIDKDRIMRAYHSLFNSSPC